VVLVAVLLLHALVDPGGHGYRGREPHRPGHPKRNTPTEPGHGDAGRQEHQGSQLSHSPSPLLPSVPQPGMAPDSANGAGPDRLFLLCWYRITGVTTLTKGTKGARLGRRAAHAAKRSKRGASHRLLRFAACAARPNRATSYFAAPFFSHHSRQRFWASR